MNRTMVWIGRNPLTRSNGVLVHRGESFDAKDSEVSAFGNLMVSVEKAKADGFYKGEAKQRIDTESVDEQSARIQREIAALRKRRGYNDPEPTFAVSEPEYSAQDESPADEAPELPAELGDASSTLKSAETDTLDLSGMTVVALRTLAKERGIRLGGARSKDDLVEVISNALAE